jgi:NTE family protein
MRYALGRAKLTDLLALRGIGSLHLHGETLAGLALPDTLPKLIEELPIPFKIIATDYDAMQERVFESGPLVIAVAASIAIPGVILGPEIGGHTFVDGGITNPLPFDRIRDQCDILVAVDVTGRPRPRAKRHRSNMELAVGSLLIMFHQVAELKRAHGGPDIHVEPELVDISGGDFFRLSDVLKAAQQAKDKFKRELETLLNTKS